MSVFTRAEALVPGAYAISIAAPEGGILAARSGISLAGVRPLEAIDRFVDTILVAGGGEEAIRQAATDDDLVRWVSERSRHTRRIGSIRSEEHTSELQSLMRNSYAVFCLKKKNKKNK